jgi:hypothetical protein
MTQKIEIRDYVGHRFARLTVVSEVKAGRWIFRCDCGAEKAFDRFAVFSGNTKSCGCLLKEVLQERSVTHGHTRGGKLSREFKAWRGARARCGNPNNRQFPHYGGRGITVCDRWLHSFENFLADMGPCPPGMSIDRMNNDKGYEPGNCCWATPSEQARNRRSNRIIKVGGERMTVAEAAERHGLTYAELHKQLYKGKKPDIAIAELVARNGH